MQCCTEFNIVFVFFRIENIGNEETKENIEKMLLPLYYETGKNMKCP